MSTFCKKNFHNSYSIGLQRGTFRVPLLALYSGHQPLTNHKAYLAASFQYFSMSKWCIIWKNTLNHDSNRRKRRGGPCSMYIKRYFESKIGTSSIAASWQMPSANCNLLPNFREKRPLRLPTLNLNSIFMSNPFRSKSPIDWPPQIGLSQTRLLVINTPN